MSFRALISSVLVLLLAIELPSARLWAQDPQPGPPPAKLNIVIIDGEGATNNIRQRLAREPIVQVEDENRRPVAGAAVVFTLPNTGASGVFPNGSRMLTVFTDQNGRAVARGLRPNSVPGQVDIRINASYRGQTASTTVTQTNVLTAAAAGIATGKLIAILAAVGGAAAAGIAVAATRNGNGNGNGGPPGTQAATTITPGTPTVGPPR